MQHSGYYLWEGITFLMQILVGTSLLVLRRKAGGRPAFTEADRQLFFASPRLRVSTPEFWVNFAVATFLCLFVGLLERLILAPFGAAVLTTAQLITFLGIVKKSLCLDAYFKICLDSVPLRFQSTIVLDSSTPYKS